MNDPAGRNIALFSYGTLQQEQVQRHQFGRLLEGMPDAIIGYTTIETEILDPEILAISGLRFHPNIVATGHSADEVAGTLYMITEAELAAADDYEVDDYRRVEAPLKSGRTAWVYVKA